MKEETKKGKIEEQMKEDTNEIVEDKMEEKSESEEVVEEIPQEEEKIYTHEDRMRERELRDKERKADELAAWTPKTKLGREVKTGKIKDLDEVLKSNRKILEEQIIDLLIPIKSDLISIGQSKGKFGGGKRRAWRQTQRKTKEGNVATFSTAAVVGDENGHVGIGTGRAKETLPARDKATRKAKLNIIRVKRTCSAFDCACSELHTVPFEVEGKSGSVKVKLIPAPQGTGLVVSNELKKVLKLAGIKDVYSRTSGRSRTTFNTVKACINALNKTTSRDK